MRWSYFFIVSIFFISQYNEAYAQNPNRLHETLEEITNTADRICDKIRQEGSSTSAEVTGVIKAELTGLASKIASAGLQGSGTIKSDNYRSVLQKDLAAVMQSSAACKLDVFKSLRDLIAKRTSEQPVNDSRWIIRRAAAERAVHSYENVKAVENFGSWRVHIENFDNKENCFAYTNSVFNTINMRPDRNGIFLISLGSDGDVYPSVRTIGVINTREDVLVRMNQTPYEMNSDGRLAFLTSISGLKTFMNELQDEYEFSISYQISGKRVIENYSMRGIRDVMKKLAQNCIKKCRLFDFGC